MSDGKQCVIDTIEKTYGSDAYLLITRKQGNAGETLAGLRTTPCDVAIGKVSADDALSMLFAALGVMQSVYGHAFTEVALAGAVLAYSTVDDIVRASTSLVEKQKVVHE